MKSTFSIRYPYLAAILAGLFCTFMTAIGSATTQIMELSTNISLLVMSVTLAISSGIGIVIMKRSRYSLGEYGFRSSEAKSSSKVLFYIPLLAVEVLPIVIFGFDGEALPSKYLFTLLFTIGIGFNEEIYFRGLALKYLGVKGIKAAIIWSSVIFGVLHLANAFGNQDYLYLILQVAFAFLVGIVLAEIVSITKSLWIVIAWHMMHDYIAFMTVEPMNIISLIILAVQVAVLLGYAVYLWKKSINQESEIVESS